MLYFLIPLYNEAQNIPELARTLIELSATDQKYFVLVNDSSTDDTEVVLHKHFSGTDYKVINNSINSGPGFSFNSGFEWILTNSKGKSDSVVTLEGDNTSDLSIFPQMLDLNRQWGYDLVLASVYAQGGGFSETTLFRRLLSAVANLLLRLCFNIKVLTLTSFYRIYSVGLVREMKNKYGIIITEKGFICKLETLVKAIRTGAGIIEVPMVLQGSKRKGKSKMKILSTARRYLVFLLWKRF